MEPQPRTKLSAEYRAWVASRLATNFISTPPPSYPIVGRPPPSRPQLQLVPRGSALRHAQPHGRRLGIQKRSNHHRQQRQVGCRSTPSSSSTPAFDLSASVQASTTAPAASAYLAAKKSSRSSIGIPPLRDDGEWPTCVVCLEPVSSHDWTSTNKCKHVFCTPCIRQWLSTNNVCPLCKVKIHYICSTTVADDGEVEQMKHAVTKPRTYHFRPS